MNVGWVSYKWPATWVLFLFIFFSNLHGYFFILSTQKNIIQSKFIYIYIISICRHHKTFNTAFKELSFFFSILTVFSLLFVWAEHNHTTTEIHKIKIMLSMLTSKACAIPHHQTGVPVYICEVIDQPADDNAHPLSPLRTRLALCNTSCSWADQ